MGGVGVLVDRPVVGQGGEAAPGSAQAVVAVGHVRPVGAEMKLAVGMGKSVEEMGRLERRLAVEPARGLELRQRSPP